MLRNPLRPLRQDLIRQMRRLPYDIPGLVAPCVGFLNEEVGYRTGKNVVGLRSFDHLRSCRNRRSPLQRCIEGCWTRATNLRELPPHAVLHERLRIAMSTSWGDLVASDPRVPCGIRPTDFGVAPHLESRLHEKRI